MRHSRQPRPTSHPRKSRRTLWLAAGAVAVLSLSVISALLWMLDDIGVPPRQMGPYVERRASGHNPAIEDLGRWIGQLLVRLDRGAEADIMLQGLAVGAQRSAATPPSAGETIYVQSALEARNAVEHARPGEVITFLPGTYHFGGDDPYINASQPGTESSRIVVRAAVPGSVQLEFNIKEGFLVSAPYWTFENLSIRGACAQDGECEHAFHIVGKASHFVARNNTITDFNAHFKINPDGGNAPDYGLVEANTLSNTRVRRTSSPVTPVDLVGGSHWTIRGNLISDFIKAEGDEVSYGGYAKGAGSHNDFQQNVILCENRLKGTSGQRVGLSLGGGGTAKEYCRDRLCVFEQQYSSIESNLIMSCSDDGIYLNRAAASRIADNTLIDTGPVVVRYPESSADVAGNLVDGAIIGKDGGMVWA